MPELICYLNGVKVSPCTANHSTFTHCGFGSQIPRIIQDGPVVAKFIGVIFSTAAGKLCSRTDGVQVHCKIWVDLWNKALNLALHESAAHMK